MAGDKLNPKFLKALLDSQDPRESIGDRIAAHERAGEAAILPGTSPEVRALVQASTETRIAQLLGRGRQAESDEPEIY